ncbi:MAG: DNA-binding protein WhiA [Lachnospiraceae bacterium]|nr:DNA-binding protein WhiA [Lachnospiraceae bacterium]
MSFSSEVKAEIASDIPSARHCRIASAAVLLTCIGRFERDPDGKYRLLLSQDNGEALRKCFTLVCKTSNIRTVVCSPVNTGGREPRGWLQADLSSDTVRELAQKIRACDSAGNLRGDDDCTVSAELLGRSCCRRNYVRDLFLCCGSVSDPRKEYHLEWSCGSKEQASQLKEILLSFGKEAKAVLRKKVHVVYFKDSEDIVDLLNLMGAPISMMEMENQRILKGLRNSVNRRVNCETANIGKTVSASRKQISDITFLEESGILRTLPESLRKMAELRLQYPDTPLRELGDLAVPPIGKSGVNHRLRRLTEIAEKYRSDPRSGKQVSRAGQEKQPDSAVKESV